MASGYSFRPRGWAFALAAAACAGFVLLGNWQSRRAEEKRALGAQLEKNRVALDGTFLPEFTVFLDNKIHNHRVGYEVVTPLRVDGGNVLVNRGWIEAGRTRDILPQVRTPAGQVHVEGVALERLPRLLNLESKAAGKVRQSLELGEFAAQTGLRLRPFFLEQHSPADDGLLRDWPRPDARVAVHESYSLQWYSFAALAVVLFIVLSFRRVAPD
jgi:surfeit locus 1 family protein